LEELTVLPQIPVAQLDLKGLLLRKVGRKDGRERQAGRGPTSKARGREG